MVIFNHRYLDSDCLNLKTFAFLAVYWSIWTLYNTDTKVKKNQLKLSFNNVKQCAGRDVIFPDFYGIPDILSNLKSFCSSVPMSMSICGKNIVLSYIKPICLLTALIKISFQIFQKDPLSSLDFWLVRSWLTDIIKWSLNPGEFPPDRAEEATRTSRETVLQ